MPLTMKNSPELTREEVVSFLIEPLEQASVVLAAGPRIFDSPTGDPLRIPKFDSVGEAGWRAESEAIGEADPDANELVLLPTILKSAKVIHRFSNELARHSVISIASTMQSILVRKIAKLIDTEFLVGVGTPDGNGNRSPIGLQNVVGAQTGTWNTTPSAADLVNLSADAVGKFYTAEIMSPRAVWFMRPQDYTALVKVVDTQGRPILQPDPTQPGRRTLQGYPISLTSKLAAGKCLLIDLNQIAVGRDLNPSVKLLDQTYASTDEMALRVVARMDIGAMQAAGIIVLTDATP